jgi:cytochrome b6-f complex iron-sulfur subunit
VKWDADKQSLTCPCHDSFFSIDGAVIEGPADRSLNVYEVKEEEGNILVKLA